MLYQIYSVYDSLVQVYGVPFFLPVGPGGPTSHLLAKRTFKDLINDPSSTIFNNPEDFHLYFIGTFSNESGDLNNIDFSLEKVASATELKEVKNG